MFLASTRPKLPLTRLPKSKLDFWRPKLEKNRIRDRKNFRLLRDAGWDILVLWECELGNLDAMKSRVTAFLQESYIPNHIFQPGARPYIGHTGSPLDEPAKTLKAGDHGVPGGENMIAYEDGSVRYFTVREAALIQTFPKDFEFASSWSENMRQIGNAVPIDLANQIARSVAETLLSARERPQ